jgi:predicted alpha/beta superfamily hydrolase
MAAIMALTKELTRMGMTKAWLRRLTMLAACIFPAFTAIAQTPASVNGEVRILPAINMPGLQRERIIRVYLPPSYAEDSNKRYGVIYMHDGQNLFDAKTSYAGEWGVDESMDALAREGIEWIVVGIDNGGEKRILELSPWTNPRLGTAEGEAYASFMVDTLKPMVDAQFRTKADREHTLVMGSSMGGLMSHYLVFRYPDIFSGAGVLSPSYWYSALAYDYTRNQQLPGSARIYLSMGEKEGRQMLKDMRKMHGYLSKQPFAENGLSMRVVAQADHNEAAWRAEFPLAVRFLIGQGAGSK